VVAFDSRGLQIWWQPRSSRSSQQLRGPS
jgi:hypothetical protein